MFMTEDEAVALAKQALPLYGCTFSQEIADASAKACGGKYRYRDILYAHFLAAGHSHERAFYMSEP